MRYRFNTASRDERIVFGAERPGYPDKSPSINQISDWIRFMKKHGITRVCCLLSHPQLATYPHDPLEIYRRRFGPDNLCWAPIEDYSLADSATLYGKILPFLTESDHKNKRVVVHCSGGIGRTGHVLAAWLVHARHYEINQALKEVKIRERNPFEAVESGNATREDLLALLKMGPYREMGSHLD
jgi:protein-tyrosine phosphatase